jgi:hypothetical protein
LPSPPPRSRHWWRWPSTEGRRVTNRVFAGEASRCHSRLRQKIAKRQNRTGCSDRAEVGAGATCEPARYSRVGSAVLSPHRQPEVPMFGY